MTSAGLETMKSGAPIAGSRSFENAASLPAIVGVDQPPAGWMIERVSGLLTSHSDAKVALLQR